MTFNTKLIPTSQMALQLTSDMSHAFFKQFQHNSPGMMFWKIGHRQLMKMIEPQVERIGWIVCADIKERMRTPKGDSLRGA